MVARQKQQQRFAESKTRNNARMSSRELRAHCKLDKTSQDLLQQSVNELGLSARAHDKVLRVARTIADLDGSDRIEPMHVTEAINYRILDRKMWLG